MQAPSAIQVRNVSIGFQGHRVLEEVSFQLPREGIVGLIGPSGGGKSVLLKILAGVLEPDAGTIIDDSTGSAPTLSSLMFQEGALFDSLSVFDNVAFPLVNGRVPTVILSQKEQEAVHERVDFLLRRVGLTRAATKIPAELSGGMRRRVSLARALASRPPFLFLDDPTSGLDPVVSSVIMKLIQELHQEHRPSTIMISHDLRRLLPAVDRVICLFHGKVVFEGTVSELKHDAPEEVHHFIRCRYDL